MHARLLALVLLLLPLVSPAETLRELLTKNNLPTPRFSRQELAQTVQGEVARNNGYTVLAYNPVGPDSILGPFHLIRFGPATKQMVRLSIPQSPDENCAGSVLGVSFLRDLTLVDLHISPSASCLLVVDGKFHVLRRLFGFDPHEVVPGQVTIIENMIHFAPVHPERLLLANLREPGAAELYPLKSDALRQAFIAEHEKHMPTQETCVRMNDPCDPEDFDEDIRSLATDGKGRFAFVASLNALHATAPEEPPDSVYSTAILYVYQKGSKEWLYCQKEIGDSQVETALREVPLQLTAATARCVPILPVVPDRSSADYSPFTVN